jgi:hypothetical protein
MSRNWKRAIACLVFVPAIFGALVPSFLHLAAWYQAWMPEGWEQLSYVAALVTEAPVFACGVCLILLPATSPARQRVYALLLWSVAVSIYVNARWAWAHTTTPAFGVAWLGKALDVLLGSAVLPVFALSCELVLDSVWRAVESDPAKAKRSAPQERKVVRLSPQPTGQAHRLAAKWLAAIERHGDGKTLTELAQLEGVSRQAVGQWRKAASPDGG